MKKKALVVIATLLTVNFMAGCSSTEKDESKNNGKSVSSEQLSKESVTYYKKIKSELVSFFKDNNITIKEYDNRVSGKDIVTKEASDLKINMYLENKKNDVYIKLIGEIDANKFKSSNFLLDLDNTIIPKVYDIFRGQNGFKYKEHSTKLEKFLKESKNSKEKKYEDNIIDGNFNQKIMVSVDDENKNKFTIYMKVNEKK